MYTIETSFWVLSFSTGLPGGLDLGRDTGGNFPGDILVQKIALQLAGSQVTHHVAIIDFFQETAAVLDGGDVGLIPVPEVGILQTVLLMGVRKVVFLE